jgi:hypothetical protein
LGAALWGNLQQPTKTMASAQSSRSSSLPLERFFRPMTIDGKRFEVTLAEHAHGWHWILAAPGELALSGDADSEIQALNCACRAGRTLARRGTA